MTGEDGMDSVTDMILKAVRRGVAADPPPAAGPDERVVAFPSPAPAPPPPAPAEGDDGIIGAEQFRQELAKKSDPMPESPLERYRPHSGHLNRLKTPERTFYCVFKDCTNRGFPYAHFDGIRLERAVASGGGLDVVVRFNGSETEEVRIAGRRLRFVEQCVGLGIMPWIWELPDGRKDDFGDHATVITSITITKIERS